nr:hypothetical protein Itr_chr10CG11250 [Ipomoea trifida]
MKIFMIVFLLNGTLVYTNLQNDVNPMSQARPRARPPSSTPTPIQLDRLSASIALAEPLLQNATSKQKVFAKQGGQIGGQTRWSNWSQFMAFGRMTTHGIAHKYL